MGPKMVKGGNFKPSPRPLGRVKQTISPFDPFSAISSRFGPFLFWAQAGAGYAMRVCGLEQKLELKRGADRVITVCTYVV